MGELTDKLGLVYIVHDQSIQIGYHWYLYPGAYISLLPGEWYVTIGGGII